MWANWVPDVPYCLRSRNCNLGTFALMKHSGGKGLWKDSIQLVLRRTIWWTGYFLLKVNAKPLLLLMTYCNANGKCWKKIKLVGDWATAKDAIVFLYKCSFFVHRCAFLVNGNSPTQRAGHQSEEHRPPCTAGLGLWQGPSEHSDCWWKGWRPGCSWRGCAPLLSSECWQVRMWLKVEMRK